MSCEEEVDPRWKFAISKNECPNCGQPIMNEGLKDLLESLGAIMTELKLEFSTEVDEWLASNYHYIRTDSEDFEKEYVKIGSERFKEMRGSHGKFVPPGTKRIIKQEDENGEITEVQVQDLQSEDRTNEFNLRAGVKIDSTRERVLELKEKANLAKSGKMQMAFVTPDALQQDEEETMMEASEMYPSRKNMSHLNSDDDPPAHVLAMASGTSSKEAADIAKLHSLVNRSQNKKPSFKSS